MSRQTLAATMPLSPVMILTAMPSALSLAIDAPASAFGRSTKVRKPARCSRARPPAVGPVEAGRGAGGDRDHAGAVGEQPLEHGRRPRPGRRRSGRARASGAPLVTSSVAPSGVRDDHRRQLALVVERQQPEPLVAATAVGAGSDAAARARQQRDVERVAADRPVAGQWSPRCTPTRAAARRQLGRPSASSASVEGDRASVRVPVLSVNSTSMLPRSSMVTSRFTSTRLRASAREPVDRLTRDDRRQQLRGDADRDREREQQGVDQRAREARR